MTTASENSAGNWDTLPPPAQQTDNAPRPAQSLHQAHQLGVLAKNVPHAQPDQQQMQRSRARHADGSLAGGFAK